MALRLSDFMKQRMDVTSCDVRPLTGSVTLCYNPNRLDRDQLLSELQHLGFVGQMRAPSSRTSPDLLASLQGNEAGSLVAKKVATMVVEKAIERSIVLLLTSVL